MLRDRRCCGAIASVFFDGEFLLTVTPIKKPFF